MSEKKYFYIETYGCQMNFSDSEIIAAILREQDYHFTPYKEKADLVLVNTCSIRENAENRVKNRLKELGALKKKNKNLILGLMGCMAERLKISLFESEKNLDIIAGPDSYRKLPELVSNAQKRHKSADTILSKTETYANIDPLRYGTGGVNAFISIMRGCENYCSYCVVPYTRGKERSRNPKTIIEEAKNLFEEGYREVTLLGQNVNSYKWDEQGNDYNFTKLIAEIAKISKYLRVRFATSHPKDMTDELLYAIAENDNICSSIHLPVQSGSSKVLKLMNRKYTREDYLERIKAIKTIIPSCGISTDIITGFPGETWQDHQDTLSLMKHVGYDFAYMFKYSERPGTLAAKKFKDDVRDEVKTSRLQEIISLQQELSNNSNKKDVGKVFHVLVEGTSKRSEDQFTGRTSTNKVIVFPRKNFSKGDYADVKVISYTAATLLGEAI